MAISEAQKRANQRWDAKNTKHYGVKMANREASAFEAACAAEGVTPHSVFLRAAREMIADHAAKADAGSGGEAETLTNEASGDSLTGKGGGAEEDADSDSG